MASNLESKNTVQGGDVMGTRKIDVSQGVALDVAEACFEPGYSMDTTLAAGYIDKASLTRGYCNYGVAVGDETPVGGKKIG